MVASLLPWSLGFVQLICGTVVTAASAWKVALTWWLGPKTVDEPAVWHAFTFSIVYLFSTFAAFLVKKEPFS